MVSKQEDGSSVAQSCFVTLRLFSVTLSSVKGLLLLLTLLLAPGSWFLTSLHAQVPSGTPTYAVNAKWVTDHGSQVWNALAYGSSPTAIALTITACGANPCVVYVPTSYPITEVVAAENTGYANTGAATGSNVQIQDWRYGDWQTAVDPLGQNTGNQVWHMWSANYFRDKTYQFPNNLIPFWLNLNAFDGGTHYGGTYGTFNKTNWLAQNVQVNGYALGQHQAGSFAVNAFGNGDHVGLGVATTCYGAAQSQGGDEGCEALDLFAVQGSVAYQASVASGGTAGSTSVTTGTPAAGDGTQGAGRWLIDLDQAMTGTASAIGTGGSGQMTVTIAGALSSGNLTTINTTLSAAVTSPGSQTVAVASTAGITTSTPLLISDSAAIESVLPTSVGSGTITATFKFPHANGAFVTSGGITGGCMEFTADTVAQGTSAYATTQTAIRRCIPIIRATSTTSVDLWLNQHGAWAVLSSGVTTQWANDGVHNGIKIYPGVQTVSVQQNGTVSHTFTLMPNGVTFGTDHVEQCLHPIFTTTLGNWILQNWFGQTNGAGISLTGIVHQTKAWNIINGTPYTYYQNGGGTLYPPTAHFVYGPFGALMQIQNYDPGMVGLNFIGSPYGTPGTIYPIEAWTAAGAGVDFLEYWQPGGVWYLTAGGRNGTYTFGPNTNGNGFQAPGHIQGSADVQGTVAVSSSTSGSTNFSKTYNNAPVCTLTPTSDPTAVGAYWVTTTTGAITAHVHTSGTITFNFQCFGN
jgi:hypothetical protein